MAKIKSTMNMSLEEFGKKAGEYALDEFEYKGLTVRQWAGKITSGEYKLVKHGRWKKEEDFIGEKYRCTMCQKVIRYDRAYVCQGELIFDFCPFCSADMRG